MKSTKTQETYLTLQNRILDAVYPPGSQLRIDLIASDLSVSTGAVREALSRLASDELVVNPPQKGFEVTPVSRQDLSNLTETRTSVEAQCLKLSLTCGDVVWEGQVLSSYHILSRTPVEERTQDGAWVARAWTEAHNAFHDSLVAACPNPWWLKLRRLLYVQAERYRRMIAPVAEKMRDIDAEHRALMESALERDVAETQRLFAAHIQLTADLLIRSPLLDALEAPETKGVREGRGATRVSAPASSGRKAGTPVQKAT